jgi:diketogulonate reductase-like aldo/keto reductase
MEIVGCGNHTVEAVKQWLALGGRRLDAADSYDTQYSVGVAMAESGVARSDIFLLQKLGNWNPMGYNDTFSQFDFMLTQMNTSYVDIVGLFCEWTLCIPNTGMHWYRDLATYTT